MDAYQRLHDSRLFAELDEREISALSRITSFRKVDRGEVLFLDGDPAEGFFILLSGRVRVFKSSADGKEYTLHVIQPGHMFAEAAIFRGGGYPANCAALEDSEVAFFPKTPFLKLLETSPQIALKMLGGLSAWLREFTGKLEALSLKEVPGRLAAYLLEQLNQASGRSFALDSSKTELAARLGTIIETLSRTLRKFRESGIIDVDGKHITILDAERLKAVARGDKIQTD